MRISIATLRWRPSPGGPSAVVGRRSFRPIAPPRAAFDTPMAVWDSWPVVGPDDSLWRGADGLERWFALAAPRRADPDARHGEAQVHLFALDGEVLAPLGPAFPPAFTDGSRDWSGTAIVKGDEIVLRFTVAGHRGEAVPSAAQRLFETKAPVAGDGLRGWSPPVELFVADGAIYRKVNGGPLLPGQVKGFRDPDVFEDDDARRWLTFTGSSAACQSPFDGVVGLALIGAGGAEACAPLVDACGINRELERPHIRRFGGRLYLFWSTLQAAFAESVGKWPTGLYGAVADTMAGPWRPLNGDGLVAANPDDRMSQAYGWLVLPDGRVTGFIDRPGIGGNDGFCGGWAPVERLTVEGDRAVLL